MDKKDLVERILSNLTLVISDINQLTNMEKQHITELIISRDYAEMTQEELKDYSKKI